jgi:hypothetical protein
LNSDLKDFETEISLPIISTSVDSNSVFDSRIERALNEVVEAEEEDDETISKARGMKS